MNLAYLYNLIAKLFSPCCAEPFDHRWPKSAIIHAMRSRMTLRVQKASLEQQTDVRMLWGEVR